MKFRLKFDSRDLYDPTGLVPVGEEDSRAKQRLAPRRDPTGLVPVGEEDSPAKVAARFYPAQESFRPSAQGRWGGRIDVAPNSSLRIFRSIGTRPLGRCKSRGFTLVELLVVIMVIALLASITLFTLQGVQENARDARTRAQIARLNDLIMGRMEEFKTRPMPIKIAAGTNADVAARLRVDAVRATMRMELPDRISDVTPAALPYPLTTRPAVSRQYFRKAVASWTPEHQSAECLYQIIAAMHDGDSSALEFFSESEIGDVDGDGMPEILDAWGNPIHFLRWAPGYGADFTSQPGYPSIPFFASSLQPISDRDPANTGAGDPFDPLRRYPINPADPKHFPLFPLIFSAGADEGIEADALHVAPYGIVEYSAFDYSSTSSPPPLSRPINNPYHVPAAPDFPIGTPVPASNGAVSYADNIHNHFRNVR